MPSYLTLGVFHHPNHTDIESERCLRIKSEYFDESVVPLWPPEYGARFEDSEIEPPSVVNQNKNDGQEIRKGYTCHENISSRIGMVTTS